MNLLLLTCLAVLSAAAAQEPFFSFHGSTSGSLQIPQFVNGNCTVSTAEPSGFAAATFTVTVAGVHRILATADGFLRPGLYVFVYQSPFSAANPCDNVLVSRPLANLHTHKSGPVVHDPIYFATGSYVIVVAAADAGFGGKFAVHVYAPDSGAVLSLGAPVWKYPASGTFCNTFMANARFQVYTYQAVSAGQVDIWVSFDATEQRISTVAALYHGAVSTTDLVGSSCSPGGTVPSPYIMADSSSVNGVVLWRVAQEAGQFYTVAFSARTQVDSDLRVGVSVRPTIVQELREAPKFSQPNRQVGGCQLTNTAVSWTAVTFAADKSTSFIETSFPSPTFFSSFNTNFFVYRGANSEGIGAAPVGCPASAQYMGSTDSTDRFRAFDTAIGQAYTVVVTPQAALPTSDNTIAIFVWTTKQGPVDFGVTTSTGATSTGFGSFPEPRTTGRMTTNYMPPPTTSTGSTGSTGLGTPADQQDRDPPVNSGTRTSLSLALVTLLAFASALLFH